MSDAVIFKAPLRVRYAETDKMGVVYNANYFVWFEVGRVELLRSLGYSYHDLETAGASLPVVEANCRYKQSALYDDELWICASIARLRPGLITFNYTVERQSDGAALAEGSSTHLVVGRDMKKSRFPEPFWTAFQKAAGLG